MKTITEEQRQRLSSRIMILSFYYASAAMGVSPYTANSEDTMNDAKSSFLAIHDLVRSIRSKSWYPPVYAYDSAMALFDGLSTDRDDKGLMTVPYGLAYTLNSIFNM